MTNFAPYFHFGCFVLAEICQFLTMTSDNGKLRKTLVDMAVLAYSWLAIVHLVLLFTSSAKKTQETTQISCPSCESCYCEEYDDCQDYCSDHYEEYIPEDDYEEEYYEDKWRGYM